MHYINTLISNVNFNLLLERACLLYDWDHIKTLIEFGSRIDSLHHLILRKSFEYSNLPIVKYVIRKYQEQQVDIPCSLLLVGKYLSHYVK